ncbi:MAG: TIM barrel protein [Nostocaceae cyanobacterium]|nr:TIM barrel protein [Nostocaceae cyanobacterium]
MLTPILAYDENSLPAATLPEKLHLAAQEKLALEIANKGNLDIEIYRQAGIPIVSVQAYAMHEFHPLHPDSYHRQQAWYHVRETLEIAAKLNVPRIVTVCGFGFDLIDNPWERSLDFFASLVVPAKAAGVQIMIEPLSPRRVGALTNPREIVNLIEMLDEPEVFSLVLDTGHLIDSGYDLDTFFDNWNYPIAELQLKGALSTPPNPNMPVKSWLEALGQLPKVVCIEHRQPICLQDFKHLVMVLR